MTAQPRSLPDNSADATNYIVHELAENKLVNGQHSAINDAKGLVRGGVAFIQANDGHVAVRRFLQDLIVEVNGRITLESIIRAGRP